MSIIKRLKSDAADAVLTTFIISSLFITLCVGFALDITKNSMIKSNYSSMSQNSVETAIKSINSQGSLTQNSPGRVYTEYMKQKNPLLNGNGTNQSSETTPYEGGSCTTVNVGGVTHNAPYMIVTLDTTRSSGVSASAVKYTINSTGFLTRISGTFNPNTKYRVLTAEIYDTTRNMMLGVFGVPCQQYKSEVSAVTFGSNSDL